jgi:ligand-binding sensor domain-containing protein
MVMFILFLSACERNNYDLLDPSSAGVMTLYTTADGLPGNEVRDIKLDSRNNLWFTFPGHGTARYNENGWTTFTAGPSQLLSNAVTVLAETAGGNIIIGTSSGLSILSASNVWSSYTEPVSGMDVSALKVASNGWVWVGTQSQGFFLNTGSGFVKTVSNRYSNVNTIEEGLAGNIFIGTDSGIIKWNGTDYSYIKKADGLPAEKISSLRFDSRNRLWIGTKGGKTASWIDQQGIHQLDLMAGSDSLSIKDIHEDRKGDNWFATAGNGVIRFDGIIPHSFKVYNGFAEDSINCISEDKDGNLWFGLASKGVVKYTLPIGNK